MNIKRLIPLALGCILLGAPVYLGAQQGDQNVVDAARKAQAEKKNAPKAKLTIDDDNIGTLTGVISVVGEQPASSDDQAKKLTADRKTAAPGAPEDKTPGKGESYWRQKFVDANKKLTDDAHELDILQREYNLKQEQYYTDPMAALKQDYSRSDLTDTKSKIDDKTALVAQDKADIANLEDELRQAGGDPGWENPPSQPESGQPAETQPGETQPAAGQPAPAPASMPQQ
jgi:hypothetical protein